MKPGIFLLLLAVACARREEAEGHSPAMPSAQTPAPNQTQGASAEPAPAPVPADDVTVATRWLDALRDGNPSKLSAHTRYPFEVHDDGGTCKDQTTSSPEQLQNVLSCLLTDTTLLDVIRNHDSAAVEPLANVHLPAWGQKWHVPPTPNLKIITGYFDRNDARANLDLWVTDGGVRGVWKSGLSGSAQIALATEWLDALRNRDLERLGRATSYPLEVRDTLRDATCGKRVAKGPDTLAASIDCMLKSDLLHRALLDSPSPGFTAYGASESLADWIQPWWRDSEHRGLQRVATMVATTEGYEFDFQMLVTREGVRVVWKAGSFEARQ